MNWTLDEVGLIDLRTRKPVLSTWTGFGGLQVVSRHHFFTVAVLVNRPEASSKMILSPATVLVPVMRPDESR
ncbi:hypothetical protein [Prosthecobacter sp.]|uniref:hypothetical protein n=1 Tax=Prosthecobacter sp. TaxID=1965333 RepID=UPI003783A748